jgi:lipoate-protein ligase A
LDDHAKAYIEKEAEVFGSWQWLYGPKLPFSCSYEDHFAWGHIRLEMQVESGVIQKATVYSDAMDWRLPEMIESALLGCRFNLADMQARLQESALDPEICKDLVDFLQEQSL